MCLSGRLAVQIRPCLEQVARTILPRHGYRPRLCRFAAQWPMPNLCRLAKQIHMTWVSRLAKFFKTKAAQRTLSAHHTDAQSFRLCQCGSQCRFNPNEGQGREGGAQVFNGNSGGCIARYHHGLQVPEGLQLLRDEVATVDDKRIAAFAIGGKPTVCPINKARLRHFCTQGLQHTQATNATVKNANEA